MRISIFREGEDWPLGGGGQPFTFQGELNLFRGLNILGEVREVLPHYALRASCMSELNNNHF